MTNNQKHRAALKYLKERTTHLNLLKSKLDNYTSKIEEQIVKHSKITREKLKKICPHLHCEKMVSPNAISDQYIDLVCKLCGHREKTTEIDKYIDNDYGG